MPSDIASCTADLVTAPQRITEELVADLRQLVPFDPEHLPSEIALVEALAAAHPAVPQVACFDTAFHAEMPPVARILPVPPA